MIVESAWHVGGTRDSCIVSSAADVLGMSVVVVVRPLVHVHFNLGLSPEIAEFPDSVRRSAP